ncbi:hypothetical protein SODG_001771 [Sodalis praecaptivus]
MKTHEVTSVSFPTTGNARIKSVAQFLAVSEVTVWRYTKRPDFPKPIKLSDRATVFDAAAVRQWYETRKKLTQQAD